MERGSGAAGQRWAAASVAACGLVLTCAFACGGGSSAQDPGGDAGLSEAPAEAGDKRCVELRISGEGVLFADPVDISAGTLSEPTAIAVADLNGDGRVDVGAFNHAQLVWFESPAIHGGDWARHDFDLPDIQSPFVGAARFGDIDGDGDKDLVLSMDRHVAEPRSAHVFWWENPGGQLAAEQPWIRRAIASDIDFGHINDMELADMDGDGRMDVIVRSLIPNRLHIFFQNEDEAWERRGFDTRAFGEQGEGFAVGDIDGQGNLDVSICGFWLEAPEDPREAIYRRHAIDPDYSTINGNCKQQLGDIDGDGRADLVLSPAEGYREGGNHVLAWYRAPADPTGADWSRTVLAEGLNGAHTVQLADLDNDGDLDVLSGVAWDMWGQTREIRMYRNQGGGRFGSGEVISADNGLYTGRVADVDGDGDLDIVGQETYQENARPLLYESLMLDGPTCSDGRRNQGEQAVDCGGPCDPCGESCGNGIMEGQEECDDGNRADGDGCSGACIVDRCSDGVLDAAEQGVDCGGPCTPCGDVRADCSAGGCDPPSASMIGEPDCEGPPSD